MLNLRPGELPEKLNISDPDRVYRVHKAYADAGADIITANTFGANRLKYDNCEELVRAGVALAKKTGKKVALDLGPTGKLLKPMGDLDFEECVGIYADVVASSSASPPTLMLLQLAIPPSDITATSHVPPPMSTIIEPVAS